VSKSKKPEHAAGVESRSMGALAGGLHRWHLASAARQPLEHGMSSGESNESAQQSAHDDCV
jgi:hypothetical protein